MNRDLKKDLFGFDQFLNRVFFRLQLLLFSNDQLAIVKPFLE